MRIRCRAFAVNRKTSSLFPSDIPAIALLTATICAVVACSAVHAAQGAGAATEGQRGPTAACDLVDGHGRWEDRPHHLAEHLGLVQSLEDCGGASTSVVRLDVGCIHIEELVDHVQASERL